MINVLGWRFYAFLIATVIIGLAALAFKFEPPTTLPEFLFLFAKSGLGIAAITIIFGQPAIFSRLISIWPLSLVVPSIHGQWTGHVTSNFPGKAKKMGLDSKIKKKDLKLETPITAEIKVSLFSISMTLKSNSEYQGSETKACQLRRVSENTFELAYVYRSHVPKPKKTDEQAFYGAGLIRFSEKRPGQLNGLQWTNRNWHKCLNTAGEIVLTRPKDNQEN